MKEKELQFDRSCHVVYSKQCKAVIRAKIALPIPPHSRRPYGSTCSGSM